MERGKKVKADSFPDTPSERKRKEVENAGEEGFIGMAVAILSRLAQ
jgi:hypothetical protein